MSLNGKMVGLAAACALAAVKGASASLVTFTFGGQITHLPDPVPPSMPMPFHTIALGDAWSLTYTFESSSLSVEGFPAGTRAFANPLRSATLTVGAATSVLPMVGIPPPAFGSLFQRGVAFEDVYELQIRMVPQQGAASPNCGFILTDTDALAVPDPLTLLTTLNLNDFENRLFYIQPPFASLNGSFQGTVTSFTPAPGSAGALGAALAFAARRRRRVG